ncbi:MAG: CehA/McbA family metallohydrolase [Myxococcota bacterium]
MWRAGSMVAAMGLAVGLMPACSNGGDESPDGGGGDAGTYCPEGPPAEGEVRAKYVGCEAELAAGTVAMGRVGEDVVLQNARARFLVRGAGGAASFLGTGAGGLVDAAPEGGVDLLKDVLPLMGFSSIEPTGVDVVSAGPERAVVRVGFESAAIGLLAAVVPMEAPPLRGTIEYELLPDDPALRMTVRVTTREGAGSATFRPGFGVLVGGAGDLWQPLAGGAAMAVEADDAAVVLRMLEEGGLTEVQSINLLQAADSVTVSEGEEVAYELRVAVGESAAEAWNAAHAEETDLAPLTITGSAGDRAEILLPDDTVAMRTRLDDTGTATLELPPGDYRVRAGFGRFFAGALQDVSLGAEGAEVDAGAAASGILSVHATSEGDTDAPVRVTVAEAGGGEISRRVAIGPTDFRLLPGLYDVTLSRGPEFDIHEETVEIADGGEGAIEQAPGTPLELPRVIDTSGWVAGDFHLHSEMSTDSRHWLPDALRIVAAEGLDVVAATDHDFITDYDRFTELAGVEGWVLTVPGAEVSHPLIAHINGYPLLPDPARSANGAPPWFDTPPSDWFDDLRALADTGLDPDGALVQINHPRRDTSGLFESAGLDPVTGMATTGSAGYGPDELDDFDVDGVEVWNKSPDDDDERTLADYLALYALGHRFAMMGNSDTHDNGRPAGSMRSYVWVGEGNDARGGFTWEDVAAGIRERRVTVCAGIFVTAEVASVNDDGTADLEVEVQAAPWVQPGPHRLRVYAGTQVSYDDEAFSAPDGPFTLPDVPLEGADFVMVRVDGGRGDPVVSHSTIGITNPIHIP